MSFGAQMRFEVKNGSKGIFWQTEKPKQSQKKFGYKTKKMTHSIRKPEQPYLDEPLEPVKPSQDFIKKNRMQFKSRASPGDKENISRNTTRSDRSSSEIKPGTVTLTQEQLNALLSTVGKFNGGDGGKLRISIDAENNRLEVETPRDNADSGPNSYRSGGDVEAEASLFDLVKNGNENHSGPNDQRDSSGYNSEDKSQGGNKVRFDTARNVERHKSPDPIPPTPALVPWKHMTLGERKRLQWAREKAAADEEEQKKHSRQQGGGGGGGANSSAPAKPEEYDPWGRPGAGAPQRKAEPEPAPVETSTGFKSKTDEELRNAIDAIEAKYGPMLNGRPEDKETLRSPPGRQSDQASEKGSYAGIPGLDPSYSQARASKPPKSQKHLEDRGNSRPSRKQDDDRERERKEKPSPRTRQGGSRKSERWRREEEERQRKEDEERARRAEVLAREEAERKAAGPAGPAAMQSSLFMGQSEPDNTRFLTKKEQEKKNWLEELDRQREDKRLQKQREKESRRGEGADDKWADRFVPEGARRGPPASQQRDNPSALPYASGGNYAVGGGGVGSYEERPAVRGQPGAPYLPGTQPLDDRPAGRQHYPQQQAPPPFASGGTYGDSSEQRGLPPAAMRSSIAIGARTTLPHIPSARR